MTAFPHRWTASRKSAVVADIIAGRTTPESACAEHNMTAEELEAWIRREHRFGQNGLKATRCQTMRAAEQGAEVHG